MKMIIHENFERIYKINVSSQTIATLNLVDFAYNVHNSVVIAFGNITCHLWITFTCHDNIKPPSVSNSPYPLSGSWTLEACIVAINHTYNYVSCMHTCIHVIATCFWRSFTHLTKDVSFGSRLTANAAASSLLAVWSAAWDNALCANLNCCCRDSESRSKYLSYQMVLMTWKFRWKLIFLHAQAHFIMVSGPCNTVSS